MMRMIEIYYDNTWYTYSWLKKLYICRNDFYKKNIKIIFKGPTSFVPKMDQFFKPLTKKEDFEKKHDIVVLAYHHPISISGFKLLDRTIVLKKIRENSKSIVWLDTADSPGTCMFDVLPYVDRYLKKQIYIDLSYYKKDLYGDRLYTNFYHNCFKINDDIAQSINYSLEESYYNKIGISWNIGISDMFSYNKLKRFFEKNKMQKIIFTNPSVDRSIDVHYRCSFQPGIYGYQRKKIKDYLVDNKSINKVNYTIEPYGKAYRKEMQLSRSVLSPYGYGEICIRDFESFFSGAILLKPDMSHIRTYPNWYVKGETYIPFAWDFSDINAIFETIHFHYEKIINVAKNGQKLFKKYTCGEMNEDFVSHVIREFRIEGE